MSVPIVKITEQYDGRGWWPDGSHREEWAIDFTATYAKGQNRPKERLTWFFPGEMKKSPRVREALQLRAARKGIVFIYIHKVWRPTTAAEIALIDECNRHFEAERKKLAKAS